MRTLLISFSSRAGWEVAGAGIRKRKVEAKTQGELGDAREEAWGVRGEADLSGELLPPLGLQATCELIRGTQPTSVSIVCLAGASAFSGLSPDLLLQPS